MLVRIDTHSSLGLADQIAAQVRKALADGELAPGDRLPPARDVAAGLEINMHTVLRAYAALREEGLVDVRRGRGAQIRHDLPPQGGEWLELRTQIRDLVQRASRLGLSLDQLIDELRKATP